MPVHDGVCEVWLRTQIPATAQNAAAGAVGIEPSRVTINNCEVGGGRPRKAVAYTGHLAKQPDHPIEVIGRARRISGTTSTGRCIAITSPPPSMRRASRWSSSTT